MFEATSLGADTVLSPLRYVLLELPTALRPSIFEHSAEIFILSSSSLRLEHARQSTRSNTRTHANTRSSLSLSRPAFEAHTRRTVAAKEKRAAVRGPPSASPCPFRAPPPLSRPSPRPYLASLVGAQTKSAPTLIRNSFPTSTPLLAFLLRKDFRPEMSLPFQSEEGEARPHRLLPLIAERARRPEEFFRGRRRRNGREDDRLLDWSRRTVLARIRPAFASAERSAPKRVSVRATEKRSSRRGADLRAFREKWKEGIGTRRCPHSSR